MDNKIIKFSILTLSCLVALSRVYLFVHYPSDIFIGALLGILVSKIICRYFIKNVEVTSKAEDI